MSNSEHWRRRENGNGSDQKPNYVQTCNLLSQIVKDKGDTMKPGSNKASAAVDLLTSLRKSTVPATKRQPSVDYNSINIAGDGSNKASTSKNAAKAGPNTAQLTIFYAGKVLVFDDYPSDRVRELVSLAKEGSYQMSYGILSNTFHEKTSNTNAGDSNSIPLQQTPPPPHGFCSSDKHVGISPNTCKEKTISSSTEGTGSDLPIARRSSLFRFLEKRKDRAVVGEPYHHIEEQPPAGPSSSESDKRFDLNL